MGSTINREGTYIDFKEGLGNNPNKFKDKLSGLVAAFANSAGGYVILGVSDKKIVGIEPIAQIRKIDEWINQAIISNIDEKGLYPDPHVVEIPESDKVVKKKLCNQ